ncbi:MAG: SsrA-binding protein SmpB [Nitrospirae bacterium]|nr:MAG: SsrA-binding protein SmpB [Nitrospirota bacterium]
MASAPPGKVYARNKQARRLYEILERFEAGIELRGTEVKSVRAGQVSLNEAYARIQGGELYLLGCHIAPWSHGNIHNHDPDRPRRLLLHRREIDRLAGKLERQGLTLVPLQLYAKGPYVKVELALARGKRLHDRREDQRRRDAEREIARVLGRGRR